MEVRAAWMGGEGGVGGGESGVDGGEGGVGGGERGSRVGDAVQTGPTE